MKVKHILNIVSIAKRVSKDKSAVAKIPALFRMLKASAQGKYRSGRKNLIICVLLIIYIISPIDLIPDFLVGIGILDDVAIAFFTLSKLFKEVDKFTEWEANQNTVIAIDPIA
ncbi:MAG: DUF1232 domain-containing protein [Flavobacteriaceae bacterium]|nr:DUF1232 domain-containing protein [Flavobacteriaceae bacterium]